MATIESAKAKYINKVRAAQTTNKYAKGIAKFLGVDVSVISSAAPVQNYNSFNVTEAAELWAKDLRAAFTGG